MVLLAVMILALVNMYYRFYIDVKASGEGYNIFVVGGIKIR